MDTKKTNVFDYLDWYGELKFSQNEFNEIDALILSIFAYLDFSCINEQRISLLRNAVKEIKDLPDEIKYNGPTPDIMKQVVALAIKATKTERFGEIGVYNYINITDIKKEIQFGAITFIIPDNTAFVSFRGTDNTIVGWKEDLNMCFINGIPSQLEAEKYAVSVAEKLGMPLRLGGHSKGGNLAIWASAHLPDIYKNNILQIYSNDAPGFSEDFLLSDIYADIKDKIKAFVPESSIVGVLMEHGEYTTIRSTKPSLLQHDPFSWKVLGSHFVYDDTRSISSRQFERVINSWIKSMSPKEREELVESIYDIISSSNAKTLDDLDKAKIKSLFLMQKTFREMGIKKQTQLIMSFSKVLFNSDILVNSNIFSLIFDDDNKLIKLD